jgi:SAM-dependent methyltransferase
MQEIIDRLKLEREDIKQDLAGFDLLKVPISRIGDFGCGWGYTSLSLMLELNPVECIGVDQFSGILDTPTLPSVQSLISQLNDFYSYEIHRSGESADIENLFANGNLPSFQVGDVVIGTHLPENLDVAYCKHVLINVFNNGYNTNGESGELAVVSAITNIAHALKQGGVFVLVEPANELVNFHSLLNQSGLSFVRMCRIHRGKIMAAKRNSMLINQDLIYIFLKP